MVTFLTFDEGVRERFNVTGSLPHLRGEDDRRINAHHVVTHPHNVLPPLAFDVLFQLDTKWAVIPGASRSTVDFPTRVDEASTLRQVDNGI